MRKPSLFIVPLLFLVFMLTGCYGDRVEVPTGYVGKILSPDGLEKGLKTPSTFRLPYVGPTSSNYRLVIAEASDQPKEEEIKVFMPLDNLNLEFDCRMTVSIPADEERVDPVFARLTPDSTEDANVMRIDLDKVYETYARPIIREKAREVITKYTIMHVMTNRDAVSTEIENAVTDELKSSPMVILNFGLADLQPPAIIVTAQEQAKEREIQIQRAEADKLVKLTEAQARLEVAKKQQEIDLLEAETQAKVEEVLSAKVNNAFVTQRGLKILEALAASNNKVIFMPFEALHNPAMVLGSLQNALAQVPTTEKQ